MKIEPSQSVADFVMDDNFYITKDVILGSAFLKVY